MKLDHISGNSYSDAEVDCTEPHETYLSKELHRPVGVGIVMTSMSLCSVMVPHKPRMQEMWVRLSV